MGSSEELESDDAASITPSCLSTLEAVDVNITNVTSATTQQSVTVITTSTTERPSLIPNNSGCVTVPGQILQPSNEIVLTTSFGNLVEKHGKGVRAKGVNSTATKTRPPSRILP